MTLFSSTGFHGAMGRRTGMMPGVRRRGIGCRADADADIGAVPAVDG